MTGKDKDVPAGAGKGDILVEHNKAITKTHQPVLKRRMPWVRMTTCQLALIIRISIGM